MTSAFDLETNGCMGTACFDVFQGRSREEPRATDEETAENLHLKKTAKWWLLFAGVMVTAYAFYHPPPISVQYSDAVLDDEDDDDVEG